MTLLYIICTAIIGLLGLIVWKISTLHTKETTDTAPLVQENATLKAELKQLSQALGKVQSQLEHEQSEKNELIGKNKTLFAQHENLKADWKHLGQERDLLKKNVGDNEAQKQERDAEAKRTITQLTHAEQALKEERQRLIRVEGEQRLHEAEERDRMWAEHELQVIATLTDLCKQPQYAFTHFTNTTLPDEFDGSLKPDFLIEFLDQYVIFDAKVSKADSLQTYINNAIKSTAEKVKKNGKIYGSIFLVVPSGAIAELKKTVYPKDDYVFYIVSPEAIAPILSSLKKISAYEFAEQMDPQKRENIINLIADLDQHINFRNGVDLIMTKMGAELIEKAQKVDPELTEEIELKKREKKNPTLNAAELKKLSSSTAIQQEKIADLVSPKALVEEQTVLVARAAIKERIPKFSQSEATQTLL